MADLPRPSTCPAIQWCDRNGSFPCYCEDAGGPVGPNDQTPGPTVNKQPG